MPGFVLLVRHRDDGSPAMRVGYTVTKKIGNAVVRNRMKRRFRALAAELLPTGGVAGADHVLIGRAGGVERDFGLLRAELGKALRKVAALPLPAREGSGVGAGAQAPAAPLVASAAARSARTHPQPVPASREGSRSC